jgi:hypothetical protein
MVGPHPVGPVPAYYPFRRDRVAVEVGDLPHTHLDRLTTFGRHAEMGRHQFPQRAL